jgi:hypothetical protein
MLFACHGRVYLKNMRDQITGIGCNCIIHRETEKIENRFHVRIINLPDDASLSIITYLIVTRNSFG